MTNANSSKANRQVVAGIYLPQDVDTTQAHTITMQAATESRHVYLNKPITFLFYHHVKELQSYPKIRPKAYAMHIRDEFKFKSDMTELVIRELVAQRILIDKHVKNEHVKEVLI